MNGFRQIKDKKFFVGSELLQICIGENEIIFNFFPDGNSITIFNVSDFLSDNELLLQPIINYQGIISQIGKTVIDFTIIDNNTAMLKMSSGDEVIFKDDSVEFEAITFRCRGQTIVV